ncbi:hypothetical protein QUB80_09255 [Chlorogloeopsis sp. ULAP01]|uniref:hypothetical protein n=1 Tax=Chlorogloeopsis sp. ULAP01 TaxID=3056483 RepID=UPI0025AB33DC|nr:hypothetical protein [Chlorogloeopsis sp. ULAP01]MDM9380889.1 hypothetical protein [Chlorogloeopsis sp. ULAP01]
MSTSISSHLLFSGKMGTGEYYYVKFELRDKGTNRIDAQAATYPTGSRAKPVYRSHYSTRSRTTSVYVSTRRVEREKEENQKLVYPSKSP